MGLSKPAVALALTLLASGCFLAGPPADLDGLRTAFDAHRSSLAELEGMLDEDYSSCLARTGGSGSTIWIGLDGVCGFVKREKHFRQPLWVAPENVLPGDMTGSVAVHPPRGVSTQEMLNDVGMPSARFQRYVELLGDFNAEGVVFGTNPDRSRVLELRLASWGMAWSSYYLYLGRYNEPPWEVVSDVLAPGQRHTGCSSLRERWFVCLLHV